MSETWKSQKTLIEELTAQVKELTEKVHNLENPRRNTGGKPRPVHSAAPEREPVSKEQVIQDLKKYKVR